MSAEEKRPQELTAAASEQPAAPEQTPDTQEPAEETLSPEQEAARLKRRRRLMHLLALFLLLDIFAAGVLIGTIRRDRQESESVRDAQAQKVGVTQDMTREEREELVAIALGKAHNHVSLRSEMQAIGGKAELYLSNELGSPCAVEMELVLMDSRETILRTGVIEPGWHLKTCALDKKLAPGEYYCIARCLFYTTDDNAYLGTTSRHVLLSVQ